jgi:hypothetical protein
LYLGVSILALVARSFASRGSRYQRLAGLLIWRKVGDGRHAGRDIEADALSRRARPR